jgi:1-acyl-sn-glycerol-3-phosphate acyltransferase
MFCPNHASLLDPFLLIAISKNPIVFVGKKELAKIPVFGFLYKRTVIMVDRSNPESRKRVFKEAKRRLQNGVSMAIFPEGLVPTEDVVLSPFKKGAFSLAIEFEIPIVPQVYYDCKRLFSWDIFKGGLGTLRVHQHKFILTKGLFIREINILKDQTFNVLYNDLVNDTKYMKDTNRKK